MKNKILLLLLIFFLISGLWAGTNQAETQTQAGAKLKAKAGRALIEIGLNLAASTANYWGKYSKFVEDWQFTLTWKDQKRKLFTSEGLRLDSNTLSLNWLHAWSGFWYYSWARTNHLSPFFSFLFSSGGSLFWEYVAEWREISSINDHIFTWVGGPAIGEPLFHIADHFRSRSGFANRIACLFINPALAINDFLDGKNGVPRVPLQDWNDFRFSFGSKQGPVSPADQASAHANLDLDLRLITLPGYGRPGSGSGYSRQPIDNEFQIDVSFNKYFVEEFFARTRCVLSGWWWKNVNIDSRGFLRGAEYWLGWVTAWDLSRKKTLVSYDDDELGRIDPWFQLEQPTRFTDKLSSMHIIGPAFNLTRYSGPLTVRFDLEATVDFSMINSLAYNAYSAGHDVWGVKTTLHNWGYYYAMGYNLLGRLDLRHGIVRAMAVFNYQRFASIQGLDRFQKNIIDDSRLADSRLVYSAGLMAHLPRSPLFFSLNVETVKRWGRFHEVSASNREVRFFYQLGVSF